MDTQQISAPARAASRAPRGGISPFGIVHSNLPHTSRFTIIGNHLAQHWELSLIAIGLAVHIQSLPTGAKVGIKALAERFPEGETTIAAALRELENHDYLRRTRERLPNGRVVTRTVSYNQPHAAANPTPTGPTTAPEPSPGPHRPAPEPAAATAPAPAPEPAPHRAPAPTPAATPAPAQPAPAPAPEAIPATATAPQPHTETTAPTPGPPDTEPTPSKPSAQDPAPPTHTRPDARAQLPRPELHDVARHRTAADLLAGLRRHEPRMLLTEPDIRRLTPAVAAWLERDVHPDALRHALTDRLPEPLTHPAALLAHRLTEHLPPPLPATAPTLVTAPFQDCEGCDRPFRSPQPGRCRDCRTDTHAAA